MSDTYMAEHDGTPATEEEPRTIKTMKLYQNLDRIEKELAFAQIQEYTAETLSPFDSMHYLGDQAVRESIRKCHMTASSHVLDIGSGLGGPARLLASWLPGVSVHALELQKDLHETAMELTQRCGLEHSVLHTNADILDSCFNEAFDCVVSWLVFLHIKDRKTLYKKCFDCLKRGGRMYVEDYVKLDHFTADEKQLLHEEVYVEHDLPDLKVLKADLVSAGFRIIEVLDMTRDWRDFVGNRNTSYAATMTRHEQVQGVSAAQGLKRFYSSVHQLFQGKHLGGVAFTVEKPEKKI